MIPRKLIPRRPSSLAEPVRRVLWATVLAWSTCGPTLAGPPLPFNGPPKPHMIRGPQAAIAQQKAWKEAVARMQQAHLPLPVFIKVVGPERTRAVFFGADGKEHVRSAPVTAGVRSRHRYAFAIEETPFAENRRFYGTIEILHGPRIPEGVSGADNPIPVNITEEDCLALARDQMLTKIVALEDPELALPAPIGPDETIRIDGTLSPDPIEIAKSMGRLMLVVRIGDRVPAREELVGVTVAGSLLLPKSETDRSRYAFVDHIDQQIVQTAFHGKTKAFSHPPAARSPEACAVAPGPTYDRFPSEACANGACPPGGAFQPGWPLEIDRFYGEYLCDGGDLGLKAGRNRFGALVNVDPSDTIAEYRDNFNKYRITESNRVCVYAPRYIEVRHVRGVEGFQIEQSMAYVARDRSMDAFVLTESGLQSTHVAQPQGVRMRQRASGYVGDQWASGFDEVRILEGVETFIGFGVEGSMVGTKQAISDQQAYLAKKELFAGEMTRDQFPKVFASLEGLGQLVMVWRHQEITVVEEKEGLAKLKLEKSASVTQANPGDTVTFEIKYTNIGNEPLSAVAVTDSLLSRLEYVDESAVSSRDAVFTAQPNDVGSHLLRWEIKEVLKPGESGTVSFKAIIR